MAIPAEIMRPFDTIIGRWKTSGSVLDEHGALVMTIDGTDEYEWMVGGHAKHAVAEQGIPLRHRPRR